MAITPHIVILTFLKGTTLAYHLRNGMVVCPTRDGDLCVTRAVLGGSWDVRLGAPNSFINRRDIRQNFSLRKSTHLNTVMYQGWS